jgi:hypothetical protein
MGISLNGLTPANTYPGLIKTGDNTAISGTPKVLSDGNGNNLPMEVSTTGVNFTNQLQQGGVAVPTQANLAAKQDTLVSGTNIKTINGASVLGSGDIVTPQPSGVSGAIQFSTGSAFDSDAANLFWDDANNRLGVGTNAPSTRLHVKGSGSTSATTSLLVQNSSGENLFSLTDSANSVLQLSVIACKIQGGPNNYIHLQDNGNTGFGTEFGLINSVNEYKFKHGANFSFTLGKFVAGANGAAWFGWAASAPVVNLSAQVQIDSTTKGFLPPRMTTTQKNAIASPAAGLVLYDSTTNKLQCYNGSTWNDLF